MKQPKKFHNILFWILLGFLSTFFAEALSGSMPEFLFTPFGYYGTFLLYALHILLIAALVISRRKPFSLRTLYFASLLFGMYEAYITKVLWQPPWTEDASYIANVAVFEFLLLVPNWHSFFSFILPLFWAESLALSSNYLVGLLPDKWQKRLISYPAAAMTGLIGGTMTGNALGTVENAFILMFANCLIISLMLGFWKLITRNRHLDLVDMLPRRFGAVFLGILMVIDYLVFGLNLNRHVKPGLIGHAAILILYAIIVLLIFFSMRKDRQQLKEQVEPISSQAGKYTFKHWFVFCLSILAGTILINLLPQDYQDMFSYGFLITLTVTGVVILFSSIRSLLKKSHGSKELI